jgi:hypothetical protein
MNLFGKKSHITKEDSFELFFQDIRKRSFEITLKAKDKEGNIISSSKCDVVKLSTLNKLIEAHFGFSMKNSRAFTKDHVV